MKEISIRDAQRISSPNPFALISTWNENDQFSNLMAVSWWTYLSNNPATIGVCISKKSFSGELIKKEKEFCLCMPTDTISTGAFMCGTCSGRSKNKADAFSIKLEPSDNIKPYRVVESVLTMECKLQSFIEVGDHYFFVGLVSLCIGDETKKGVYALDGYKSLGPVSPDETKE